MSLGCLSCQSFVQSFSSRVSSRVYVVRVLILSEFRPEFCPLGSSLFLKYSSRHRLTRDTSLRWGDDLRPVGRFAIVWASTRASLEGLLKLWLILIYTYTVRKIIIYRTVYIHIKFKSLFAISGIARPLQICTILFQKGKRDKNRLERQKYNLKINSF